MSFRENKIIIKLRIKMEIMEIKDLIDWIQSKKQKANPFNKIPENEGIYSIFVLDKDINDIKFGRVKMQNGKHLVKGTREINKLERVYSANVGMEKGLDTHIIYIGKAKNLRKRIYQYMSTVFGGKNHKGGIDIWAIQNYELYLHIEWQELAGNNYKSAREWEKSKIREFKENHHNNRPMANRQD